MSIEKFKKIEKIQKKYFELVLNIFLAYSVSSVFENVLK